MPSVIGDLGLEVIVELDARPDATMFDALSQLAGFASKRAAELRTALFSHYSEFCRNDPDWVVACGVPLGLSEHQVVDYVGFASACVSRRLAGAQLERYFHIRPQRDEEHDIFLGLTDDRLAPLDD